VQERRGRAALPECAIVGAGPWGVSLVGIRSRGGAPGGEEEESRGYEIKYDL